jgi:hypothetical protein
MQAADVGPEDRPVGTSTTLVRSKRETPEHVQAALARMKQADVGGAPVPGAKRGKRAANARAVAETGTTSTGGANSAGDTASE